MNWTVFNDSHLKFKHDRQSKVCVVTAYSENNAEWRMLGDMTSSTKVSYCRSKGYGFRAYVRGFDVSRPHSWSKMLFIMDALRSYEWVWWVDGDAAVTSNDTNLLDLIPEQGDMVVGEHIYTDNAGNQHSELNLGSFMLKRGEFSEQLFQSMWNKDKFINHNQWEQAAFNELYSSPDIASHIKVVQGNVFNSANPWKTYDGAGKPITNKYPWKPGDFVIHIGGMNVFERIYWMQYLLLWNKGKEPFFKSWDELLNKVLPETFSTGMGVVSGFQIDMLRGLLGQWKGKILLTDQWKFYPGYRDICNFPDNVQEDMFRSIASQFSNNPTVSVQRGTPTEVAEKIPDESLDWVFIDGPHGQSMVDENLKAWWPKVRKGGILCGHDYIQNMSHGAACFEVKDTVDRFAASVSSGLRHSIEDYPGWAIHKVESSLPMIVNRNDLASLFKNRGYASGVEIGVLEGDFSEKILSVWNGDMWLVDVWKNMPNYRDDANLDDMAQEARYQKVLGKFKDKPNVHVLRKPSVEAAKGFTDESLDWVYIDANHSYEAVKEDLEAWYSKVKPGGMLCGHDYIDVNASFGNFGVRRAVDEFFANKGMLVAKTTSQETLEKMFPSWFVTKDK